MSEKINNVTNIFKKQYHVNTPLTNKEEEKLDFLLDHPTSFDGDYDLLDKLI
jgi:hypothetical protein|tara:strand:- start:1992 stop:2147 length:156 start_codon:yes stop_codon:yes gene_type:complete